MAKNKTILGQPISASDHYTIVGGGISGLMMGFFLKETGVSFEIHEKSNRIGGLIDTIENEYGWVETGANGILWCKEIEYVANRLGLEPMQPNQKDKKRFFVRNKKLRQFPLNPLEALTLAARLLVPHHGEIKTVADFGNAYLGAAATRQILSPALSGIYGTPAEKLSFDGSAKMLSKIIGHSRWLPLGMMKYRSSQPKEAPLSRKGLQSFKGGMRTLVDALGAYLKDHIQLNSTIDNLASDQHYILTTSASQSAKIIYNNDLKQTLQSIEYQSLISATLTFKRGQLSNFKPGFGCLIPRNEGLRSLGILFTSIIYPERVKDPNTLSLRCILHQDDHTRSLDDGALVAMLSDEIDQLFQLSGSSLSATVHRWEEGLPIYTNALKDLWPKIDQLLKSDLLNVRLFGNYTGEISVRGACQSGYRMMQQLS